MPKPMSASQARRAERDQKLRKERALAAPALPPEAPEIDMDKPGEILAWARELGAMSGIVVQPDIRLHRRVPHGKKNS